MQPLKTRRLVFKVSGYGFTNNNFNNCMPVKLRLQRRGRKKQPFYHIVAADIRSPRDGRFIERLGSYNPMTKPATIEIDRDRAFDWVMKGAQPTDTVRAILRFKGVYYRKHLARGVKKGALTQEEADAKYQAWVEEKDAKIAARFEKSAQEREAKLEELSGTPPPKPEPEPEPEPAEEAAAEDSAAEEKPAAEESQAENSASEEAAAEEPPAEEQAAEGEEEKK